MKDETSDIKYSFRLVGLDITQRTITIGTGKQLFCFGTFMTNYTRIFGTSAKQGSV